GTRLVASGPEGIYAWDLRLIRRQLKEIGLDWEWPEFPPPDPSRLAGKPLSMEGDIGEPGKPGRQERGADGGAHYRGNVPGPARRGVRGKGRGSPRRRAGLQQPGLAVRDRAQAGPRR